MVKRWHLDNGREGKKSMYAEDHEKKVKTVMVNNSTNINHHSLNTKRGSTPSDVANAGHGLGQDKRIGSEKMHCIRYTNDHSKQLMLVVLNMTFSIHKELVYVPSHGKVNII